MEEGSEVMAGDGNTLLSAVLGMLLLGYLHVSLSPDFFQ